MIIYNVTVKIDNSVHDEWLEWMKEVHIPDVMATGLFIDSKICKVVVDDDDGGTYSIQYTANSMDDYNKYQKEFAAKLQEEHTTKYKDKFVAFRTIMVVSKEFKL
ncbi:MAG: hypothetical protein COA57_16380 [Flavobacteriales bacterium]|nr:MAG: hypothetical protein COA57_16380 [Flavobacteriales bacterium]